MSAARHLDYRVSARNDDLQASWTHVPANRVGQSCRWEGVRHPTQRYWAPAAVLQCPASRVSRVTADADNSRHCDTEPRVNVETPSTFHPHRHA